MDQPPQPPGDQNPYKAPEHSTRSARSENTWRKFVLLLGFAFLVPSAVLVAFGVTCTATVLGSGFVGSLIGDLAGAPILGPIGGLLGTVLGLVFGGVVATKVFRTCSERWRRGSNDAEAEESLED